jgi:hydrogenase maturation protease
VNARSIEALVLGVGNVLWADGGFGVHAIEVLHEAYEYPQGVLRLEGGIQGSSSWNMFAPRTREIFPDRRNPEPHEPGR